MPYTHFVCVPLPGVKAELEKFKQAALREFPDQAKPAMFVPAAKVRPSLRAPTLPALGMYLASWRGTVLPRAWCTYRR